ncbi:tyrosine-type recombinase/integrase [Lysinibacillus telephonicus]|uniref:tyrosine-type recombinase/integrase n=1 Tax=Lysinibacillus telephonicus TaxID=1714840 RepID=UPI0037D66879
MHNDCRKLAPARAKGVIEMARQKLIKTKKDCIYEYKESDGTTKYAYRYKYYDKLQKRREKTKQGFATIAEAERALIEVKADILDGNESFVESDNYTVENWAEIWISVNKNQWRPGTLDLYERRFKKHINPLIGKRKLNKLTNMVLQQELVNPLFKKGLSRQTVKDITRTVISALNSAVEERILKENPITKLDYGKAPSKKSDNYYNQQELNEFLKLAYKHDSTTYYTIFLTLAFSGIRKGELAGLRWGDIDFNQNTLTIERSRVNKKVGPPKSDNGYRTIKVNDKLIEQLKKYKAWCIKKKWSIGKTLKKNDYVFIDRFYGNPISETYINDALDSVLENSDLRDITPHGLRHTYASILIANKVPVVTVAKLIGDHPMTVSNVYAHSLQETEEETVELFDKILL